jgi:hypothetical protein
VAEPGACHPAGQPARQGGAEPAARAGAAEGADLRD